MLTLLITTLITSFIDSFNPIAITQQFVLQGMVRKPSHILYFILPTGITNFLGGLMVYYGVATLVKELWTGAVRHHADVLFAAELLLAGVLLIVFVRSLRAAPENEGQLTVRGKLTPTTLVVLGVTATITELLTALPYFAFLAILLQYELSLPVVSAVLLLYNLIYMAPLLVMYLVYMRARRHFDVFYQKIHLVLTAASRVLAPLLILSAVGALTYHALFLLR